MIPKTTEAQVLGKQMLRSGTSVGANYREAYRAGSKSEIIAKCGDSLRELEETAYWLELLVEGKIVPAETVAVMRRECDELLAIFATILKRSKDTFLILPFSFFLSNFAPDHVLVVTAVDQSVDFSGVPITKENSALNTFAEKNL